MEIQKSNPAYNRLMQFAKNYQKKHGTQGLSNLYLIQSVDENGNIVDEKYGMNLMTNYGFENFFKGGASASFPTTIYFGNGTGSIELDSASLINNLGYSGTTSSTTIDYNLPLYYDSEGGIITLVCQYMTAYLPATISGVTQPFAISEYGIGTSATQLWTHSFTYNSEGEISNIIKRVNIQLNITVYFCMSINKSIIQNAWNGDPTKDPYVLTTIEPVHWNTDYTSFYTKSGNTYTPVSGGSAPIWTQNTYYEKIPHLNTTRKYILFCRMCAFFDRMHYTDLMTFKNNNVVYSLPASYKDQTTSQFDQSNHSFTKYMTLNPYTLNPGTSSSTGYISGFRCSNSGLGFIERILLQQSENFASIIPIQSDLSDENCLSNAIGVANGLQFDQPFIEHCYCYNYQTGDYDLEEDIDIDNSIWYNEFLNNTSNGYSIFYDVNGAVSQLYLYANPCTDNPIIGFKASSVQTIIATDEYWDSSKWTLLTTTSTIPASEQRRRYYLTSSINTALQPVREKRRFNIRPLNGYTRTFGFLHWLRGSRSYASSVTRDFYVLDNYLYRISQNEVVDLGTGSNYYNTEKYIICYDDSIVTVKGNGTIYTTQYKDQGTIENTTFAHTSGITNFMNCQITEGSTFQPENIGQVNANKNGLVMFSLYNTTALLLKIRSGLVITETVINDSLAACMLNGSTYYAYILKTDNHVIVVKDGETGNPVTTITLNSNYATPKYMFGFRDKLYVCDGSSYTLLIDLSDNSVSECNVVIGYGSDTIKNIRVTSVDDVMVVYRISGSDHNNEFYFRYDDPTTIHTLNGLEVPSTYSSGSSNIYRLYKKYGALYLIWNTNYDYSGDSSRGTSTLCVYEFSKFLYNGTSAYSSRLGSTSQYILFGDNFISQNKTVLLSNFITHKITGKTNTVTAQNNIKNLSGEQWTTTITNAGTWAGLPPGNKLGT